VASADGVAFSEIELGVELRLERGDSDSSDFDASVSAELACLSGGVGGAVCLHALPVTKGLLPWLLACNVALASKWRFFELFIRRAMPHGATGLAFSETGDSG
jgi:hypothetical protein